MGITVRYSIFALVATGANIGSQDISLRLYDGLHAVLVSVLVGTAVGLGTKYVLDKRYIFRYQVNNTLHDMHTFLLYTIAGLATTLIFWGFEFGFHLLFETKKMRYLGGVIGLAIGYYAKYQLDQRYVFVPREA